MKTRLLIIAPQNDFRDPSLGSLYVKGACPDMEALAELIARRGDLVDENPAPLPTLPPQWPGRLRRDGGLNEAVVRSMRLTLMQRCNSIAA